MRILVVGGAGYVGSTSVEAFLDAGHDVIVFDDLSTGHAARSSSPPAWCAARSRTGRAWSTCCATSGIDAVLHCAAKSLVGESMADPALYYRHNVTGGVAMLEAMRDAGVTRLVYSSTAAVYGEPRRVPIAEADRTEPINPYGATKLAFEGAMRWFAASARLPGHQPALLQRRRRDRAQRRGPRAGDAPDPAGPAGGGRRGEPRPDLRPGLPDARTAPASATSSTSATWPPRTCWRSRRPAKAIPRWRSTTSARPPASACGRWSRPPAR